MNPFAVALMASLTLAAGPKRKPPRPGPAATVAPPPATSAPSVETPSDLSRLSVLELATKMRVLNQDLEFDKLVPYAQGLVGRTEASLDLKREAWLLLGTAFVILGDPVAAERPFTQLLRVVPDVELPATVEPKVALVFRKVQAEERELARALKVAQRETRIRGISIDGAPPEGPKGGRPLTLEFVVRDPSGDVRAVRFAYRRKGEGAFSSLALVEGSEHRWQGVLPAEVSANSGGLTLDYYVETADTEGALQTLGRATEPRALVFSEGQVEVPRRPPLPRWAFGIAAGATAVSATVAGLFFYSYQQSQEAFTRYANSPTGLSFQFVEDRRAEGQLAASRATAALITAGVVLAITGVVALFVDWSG